MVRVRFAPSPTGSLHLGSALTAVANRRFADEHGGTMLLRIDDTDASRTVEGAVGAILADLEWLGLRFEEGSMVQSERAERHREAAASLADAHTDAQGALRLGRATLLRADGRPTYPLASAVDDVHFDEARLRRLAVEAIGSLDDEELAARVRVDPALAPALRGARDLNEARAFAEAIVTRPQAADVGAAETLERFRELRERANG